MKAKPTAVILGAGLVAVAFWTQAALAAPAATPKSRAPELQAIVDCRAIADRDARLSCYDAAADKLDRAEASGQVVVVNREQVRSVRKDVFGLQLPSLDIFSAVTRKGPGGASEEVDRLDGVVKTAWRGEGGHWMFELETGAVWRQIDDFQFANDPHAGSKVEIRKGALGSFIMKVDRQPSIKVHRDR